MPDDTRSGGCLCGGVRYSVRLPALWVAHCHCSMCRRAQGAGFVTWVGIARERFAIDAGADLVATYRSSPRAIRRFCRNCGTPLFFESERWPGDVHVTLATLDSAAGLEPTTHAYWNSRAPWADWQGHELDTVEPG